MAELREITDDGHAPIRPTQERLAKGGMSQQEPNKRDKRAKPWNANTAIFDMYRDHSPPLISEREWKAADTFCRIYYRAQGSPWRTQNWAGPVNGSSFDISESRVSAQKQLDVIASKLTADLYAVLRDVCGLMTPVTTWARNRQLHPNVGMPLLHQALELYARHLGLPD